MKRRIYSDKFLDSEIAKIDALNERSKDVMPLPYCLSNEGRWGPPRLNKYEREEIRKYYKQFQNMSYVSGFWYGWTLRNGVKDE